MLLGTLGATVDAGMIARRRVLGDDHVDRAIGDTTPFTEAFQDFITRIAWGRVLGARSLDRKTRSCITLALLCALGYLATSSPCTRAPGRDRPLNTPDRQTLSDVARARGLSRAAAALPSQAEPRRLRGRIPHGLQFLFFGPARARSDPSRGAFY